VAWVGDEAFALGPSAYGSKASRSLSESEKFEKLRAVLSASKASLAPKP
jgi:hypothetical protein